MFNRFWASYPKKRSKGQAASAFKKIKPDKKLLEKMITAVKLQIKTDEWTKNNGQFIPYPATWLNAKGWLDEISAGKDENCDPDTGLSFMN